MNDPVLPQSSVEVLASTWQRERISELERLLREREVEIASLRLRVADSERRLQAFQPRNGHAV